MKDEIQDTLLETSLKTETNIIKTFDIMESKELKENSVSNINSYKRLLTDLISRVKAKSKLKYLCNVIPTITPEGVVYSYGNRLSGKQSASTVVTDTIRIFLVTDTSSFAVDGSISSDDGAEGTVLFISEEEKYILVKVESGLFKATDLLDNVPTYAGTKATLTSVYNASHMLGTILPDYNGPYSVTDGETLVDFNQTDFSMNGIDLKVESQILNTGYTVESLQDLVANYGIKYRKTFIDTLVQVATEDELNNLFRFLRSTSFVNPNITLTSSYGTQGSINDVYEDLWNRVNQSCGSIGTKTGISGGTYGVSASSKVFSAIKSVLKGDITYVDDTVILPGGIPMIEDGYSIEDYLCVSLIGPNNNGAVIFTPYDLQVMEAIDPKTFDKGVKVLDRYDIVDNPLATKLSGKNEMSEITFVEGFSSLTNEV